MKNENILKEIFNKFSANNEMEYFQFSLFCQKYKLVDNKFNLKDIDSAFAFVRTGKKRTINYNEFKKSLEQISQKKGKNIIELITNQKLKPKITQPKDIKKNENKKNEILERQEKLRSKQDEKNNRQKVKELLEDICSLGTIMKNEIIQEKKSNPENFIPIKEALSQEKFNSNEGIFCLGVLAKNLEDIGIITAIEKSPKESKESQNESNTVLEFIMSGMIEKKKFNLHFDLGEKTNNELLNNKDKQNEFNKKIAKKISLAYNIPEDEIILTNPQKGSYEIQLIFQSEEFNDINLNINSLKQKFKNDKDFKEISNLKDIQKKLIMEGCKLSPNMLDSNGNRISGWAKGEKRGGLDYIPPEGWKGFGLKVNNKYDNGNNDWLACNGNINEWAVAYHGIGAKITSDLEKASNSIIIGGFKPGSGQNYQNDDDANHPGQKIGRGVYCSPDPNVLESYAKCFKSKTVVNGKKFMMGFMMRVKPDKIRFSNARRDYWVLDGTTNEMRPYRLLIKEC